MRKGQIALLGLSILSTTVLSATRTIDSENHSHLLDVVPLNSYMGDFGNKRIVGTTVHTGLDILPSYWGSAEHNFTINGINDYSADNASITDENVVFRDITAAYDGYVVGHKSYSTITALNVSMYGDFYLIKHPQAGTNDEDLYTLYLHMAHPSLVGDQRSTPNIGDYISKGDFLGIMYKGGTSSNRVIHLHYSVQTFSDFTERPNYNRVYPERTIALGDSLITVNGVQMTRTAYYDSIIKDPDDFTFPISIDYVPSGAFSLASTLHSLDYQGELTNTLQCNELLNTASKRLSVYNNLETFESNFSSLFSSANDESDNETNSCLFKDSSNKMIVRYQVQNGNVFVYDYNIRMGQSAENNLPAGASLHQFTLNDTTDYDRNREVYDFWNGKIGDNSSVLSGATDLVNSSLSTYTSGDIDSCMVDWNSLNLEADVSDILDANLHIFKSEGKCIIYDRFNTAYLSYNPISGLYKYGTDTTKYDLLRSQVAIDNWLRKSDPCTENYCQGAPTERNEEIYFWLKHNTAIGISLFHESIYVGNEQIFYAFDKVIDGKQKYVYMHRSDKFAIVYDTLSEVPEVVMEGTDLYRSLKDFRYNTEEYVNFLQDMLNHSESPTNGTAYKLNFKEVKLLPNGSVECSIVNSPVATCGNSVIDNTEECSSIWKSSFYHSDSFNGYTSTLAENNVCHYKEENTGDIIIYDANLGKVTLAVNSGISLNDLNVILNTQLQDFYSFQGYMYKDFCDVYLSNLKMENSSNIKAYEWKYDSCFFEDKNNVGEFIYIKKHSGLSSVIYHKLDILNEEFQFSKTLKKAVGVLRNNSLLINSSETCNNSGSLLPTDLTLKSSYYYYYRRDYCSLYLNNKFQINIMYDGVWALSFS